MKAKTGSKVNIYYTATDFLNELMMADSTGLLTGSSSFDNLKLQDGELFKISDTDTLDKCLLNKEDGHCKIVRGEAVVGAFHLSPKRFDLSQAEIKVIAGTKLLYVPYKVPEYTEI